MTLPILLHVARNVIRESWLVCPECGGPVVLLGGTYFCDGGGSCNFMTETLAPLRAVPKGANR